MSRRRSDRPIITCVCGCEQRGERRGPRQYIRACYERWRRAGNPPEGPPPPDLRRRRSGAEVEAANRKRRRLARDKWAGELAETIGAAQATGRTPPRPVPGWYDSAACHGTDNEAWFAPEPDGQLLRLCDGCPVRTSCLVHALTTPERYGTWAGQSQSGLERHRRRVRQTAAQTAQTAS